MNIYTYTFTYIYIYIYTYIYLVVLPYILSAFTKSSVLGIRSISLLRISSVSNTAHFCVHPYNIRGKASAHPLTCIYIYIYIQTCITLRPKWHYCNNRIFHPNPFKPKSKFNPPKRDAAIELYLSRLEEKLLIWVLLSTSTII